MGCVVATAKGLAGGVGKSAMTLAVKHQTQLSGRVLGYRSVQVLEYVRTSIAQDGQAPTYEMICDKLQINGRHKVCEIVKRLERRGLLSRVGRGRVFPGHRRIRLGVVT